MYVYDEHDRQITAERVEQFRDQTRRALAGELSEDEFLPLRLQNGLYVQRLAPMLRIAVPYGMLRSGQLRRLARITRDYDKGYAHFTTRQNVQLNWPAIEDVPDILAELAEVEMHANQTSGNCIRNTTTDQFSGAQDDEIADPRPYCEIIRQWSTFHPEFAYLPRKFKVAVNASEHADRAAIQVHDIGLQMVRNQHSELGFRVHVGGGLGRTPMVGPVIREFLPEKDLLTYLEAVLRVYNRYGRRDNKFKARIKILVKALTPEGFAEKAEAEWQQIKDSPTRLTTEAIETFKGYFTEPAYQALENATDTLAKQRFEHRDFDQWVTHNVDTHKKPGYAIATLTMKKTGIPPGDVTDRQLEQIADLADQYSFGEVRVTHQQNVVLADVRQDQLFELWQALVPMGFATANLNTLTDVICCPGGDFCSLANAKSIPVAEAIQRKFDDMDYLYDIGEVDLNISGCMNACGHHHVGNIGVLGVDKKGQEFYQVSLGGSSHHDAAIGKILGPSFAREDMPDVIKKIIDVYVDKRKDEEPFLETYRRIGIDPFKERVYAEVIAEDGAVREDDWVVIGRPEDGESLNLPDAPALIPVDLWLAGKEHFEGNDRIGVWFDSHQEPEMLDGIVNELKVIAVNFPKFADGRGYSIARLLRERLGYKHELRAIGDVLLDQLQYMKRCGFDVFALRSDKKAEDAARCLSFFTQGYQAATDTDVPLFRRRAG